MGMYRKKGGEYDSGFSNSGSSSRAAARKEAIMKELRPGFVDRYTGAKQATGKAIETDPRSNREGLIRAQRMKQSRDTPKQDTARKRQSSQSSRAASSSWRHTSFVSRASRIQEAATKQPHRRRSKQNSSRKTPGASVSSSSHVTLQGCDAASQLLHRAQRNQRNNTQ